MNNVTQQTTPKIKNQIRTIRQRLTQTRRRYLDLEMQLIYLQHEIQIREERMSK
jgi:predicted  nucleic acid-binding Zn-ribbon protein